MDFDHSIVGDVLVAHVEVVPGNANGEIVEAVTVEVGRGERGAEAGIFLGKGEAEHVPDDRLEADPGVPYQTTTRPLLAVAPCRPLSLGMPTARSSAPSPLKSPVASTSAK